MSLAKISKSIITTLLLTAVLAGGFPQGVVSASELTGSEILEQVDKVMSSDSREMSEKMTLYSASGQERSRELMVQNKRTTGDDMMLVRFMSPADVRGTGLLMVNDDMWLYLPALGRVRRIAGHAKKGGFMGSDLSYDDMEQFGSTGFSSGYHSTLVKEELLDGQQTYLLDLKPKGDDSEYQGLRMWVDQEKSIPRRIEYLDETGSLLKVLSTSNLQQIDGRWVALRIEMQNVQSGTKTILEVSDVSFDTEIPDRVFTTRSLERGN